MTTKIGIGQDSHRFLPTDSSKQCVIGGIVFDEVPGFNANSDGDVIFHAICNAISSLTTIPILGGIADELCLKEGVVDSEVYLKEGLKTLGSLQIEHLAITLEAKRPKFLEHIPKMRENIARILEITPSQVGITATTGEGLTDFGCGDGVQCFAILTAVKKES
ncbi:MAG: 2-C-methyl-D-erythritol 2,4-cyclodiphosphate synthase [Waddliaceae bacterium]